MRSNIETSIWDNKGRLLPLNPPSVPKNEGIGDVAIIVVNRDRGDLTDKLVRQLKPMGRGLLKNFFVVEMGSEKNLSSFSHFYYKDKDYRGKCYGHNVGLRWARSVRRYKYYWLMMNDLVFNTKQDVIIDMIGVMNKNPKIGVLSPSEPGGSYINCKPKAGSDFHCVTTCDYLSLLIREEVINSLGFLNPAFKYCWGAIHEYAYKLYKNGWWIAYCDKVAMKHLGGTTYGKVKNVCDRDTYRKKAAKFAARYFVKNYGRNWDKKFSKVIPKEVGVNAFPPHRVIWESFLSEEERKKLHG